MRYIIELKPRAVKDLRRLPKQEASRIADALEKLEHDLAGDVKRLTNFFPEYRLRIGSYRALFEVEDGNRAVIYRVLDRREAYRQR